MTRERPFSDSRYFKLLKAIKEANGVPCEETPSLFYPEDVAEPELRSAYEKVAKRICKTCPILNECFVYAIETNQKHGIWGGTSPDER